MKSKKIEIQTILMKGTILFLILTMLSSFLPIMSVFAEEIDETTTGSDTTTGEEIIEDEESDYILSEDVEHITGVIIDEIDKLKEQLQNIDESFNYTKFIEKIALQDVIEISNELELRALSIYVAEGNNCLGKTFKLTKNIVLTDTIEWNPIGDSTTTFRGTFDGAGYTVSGILISIKQNYAGFVGYLGTGGTIKDLTIANSKISIPPEVDNKIQNDLVSSKTVGYSYLGAIAGRAISATISNCKNSTSLNGGTIVGGIVGRAENTTIEYCSNSGKVQSYRTAGGIVGSYDDTKTDNATKRTDSINKCRNTGTVYAITENAGGISGTAWNNAVISNCINDGTVYTAKSEFTIYLSTVEAKIKPQNTGGIVGIIPFDENAGTVIIENCLNNGKVDGYIDVGGLIGQAGTRSNPIGKININKCINNYAGFNSDNTINDEYKGIKNVGEFIGFAGVSQVKTTIKDSYILTENEDSSSKEISGYITDKTTRIRAFGKIGSGTVTATFEGDKDNLFHKTSTNVIKKITDTQAPVVDTEKGVTIVNSGNSQSFAVKGDILTITIPFDEPININRIYPQLNLINENTYANYVGIDGKNLIYKYKVTGKETTSSIDLENINLSGSIYDVFGNTATFNLEPLETESNIRIVNTNTDSLQNASVSYSNGEILYTISGFSKVTEDGKLYFNKDSNIKIEAKFSGKLTIDIDSNSDIPKLYIMKYDSEWCSIDNGKYNSTENKVVYEFKAGDKAENQSFEIHSLYLTTNGNVTVAGKDFGKFTEENTSVTVNNIYVDTKSPKLTISASVNNKTENNKYTIGEDILIKVTTSEPLDIANSIMPEINVSFSESGLGKYNSQEDSTKTGNAKYMETVKNENGTVTYKYRYTVQDGDEGNIQLSCISDSLKVYDIAGNKALSTEINYNTDNMYVDTTAPTVQIKTLADLGDKYDFNGDGITNYEDADLIGEYIAGLIHNEEIKQKIQQKGDADGNGQIDITDSVEIKLKLTSDIKNTNKENLTYIFAFSEKVEGFTKEDITVNNGIKGEFKEVEEGKKYTLEVQSSTTDGNEGVLQVIVEADTCKDLVGYGNIRQESNITIDKVRPTFTSYQIKEESGKIIIEAIFSEALSDASKLIPTITVDGKDGRGTWEKAEIYDNNKVRFVYNIAGADGGKVEVSLKGTITDIAGNNSEELNISVDNHIELEQTVIRVGDDIYSFEKNGKGITNFAEPTYFVKGDAITVIKTTSTDDTTYTYMITENINLSHIKYMTLTEPVEGAKSGRATFSNQETAGSINIEEANIWFDTVAPIITLSAKVEEKLESGVYSEGTKIIVEAKTSEPIVNKENVPQINVSFSNSGLGKYNYQGENVTAGNAKHIETIENEDGSISWKYEYIVQNGDEGSLSLEYASQGEIEDLAGNKTTLEEYPEVSKGDVKLSDITISGKETKISYEIYKNNNKITNFKNNTYFTDGDTIKVIAKFTNELYSAYGSTNTYVSKDTAPELEIDGKKFDVNKVNAKEITYTYHVDGDKNEKLDTLKLTTTKKLYAKKSDNNYETISGKLSEVNIQNCNLHIYNAGTKFVDSNINVDTTAPTVVITTDKNNPTNADTIKYTFTWSEQVEKFTIEDITVNNGTKGEFKEIIQGKEYTLDITTSVETGNVGDIQVIVEKNACQDKVGLSNVRTESVIRVDKRAPIIIGLESYAESTINLDSEVDNVKQYYKVGDTVIIVATFDESIEENTNEVPTLVLQFSESGNAKGNVSAGTKDGNKITYTYTIKDTDNGILSIKGFSGKVIDAAGNEAIVTKRELTGDTIIADTKIPTLNELKVITEEGSYKEGREIEIEAIYSEEVYALITKEDGTKEIVGITNDNAPVLSLTFGGKASKGNIKAEYGTKEDGSKDRTKIIYTYTIANGDNGLLSINKYENKENIKVCDIAGNEASLIVKQTGNKIIADTIRPEVNKIEATVENTIIKGTAGDPSNTQTTYYKEGNEIKIVLTFSEKVSSAVIMPKIQIGFSESKGVAPTSYSDYAYESNWNVDSETIEYSYKIKDGDNGYLWVKVPEGQFKDAASNTNIEKATTEIINIFADTTKPTVTLLRDTSVEQDNQTIVIKAQFSENVYDLKENTRITLSKENAPKLVYSFGTGENKEVTASRVEGKTITYTIKKDPVEDNGTLLYELAKGNLCDRAGNEYYTETTDTTAPILEDIYVYSDSEYLYCKKDTNIYVKAIFNENIEKQNMKLKIKIGEGQEKELTGQINSENKTEIIYKYTVLDGDNGKFEIVDIIGNNSSNETLEDKTYGYVKDEYGNQANIFNLDGYTIIGSEIADTIAPRVTITSDVEETNKDLVTYTFTWSEPVYGFTQDDIEIINGSKGTFTGKDGDKIYTLTVDSTNEGRQIVKVNAGVCEDKAGNLNTERAIHNKVEIDYTKPTVRAKINGGNFVIDTDSQKSTLKETIVVNEELSKFEYAWSTQTDIENVTEWDTEDVSDIIVNSDINLSKEVQINDEESEVTYYLYLKVTDEAGNELRTRTKEFKVCKSAITFEGISENPTKEDVTVTVKYGKGLTENRKAGISGKTQSADSTKVILSENGTVYAEATDEVGNKVYAKEEVNNIDKTAPTAEISYTENEDGSVTATITLSDGRVTNNNGETTYIFKENGEFTFEFEDDLGNKATATAKVTTIKEVEVPVEEDKEAPTIMFSYTLTNNTVGNSIGATIITNEDAKISYSWDNENWTETENYVSSVNAVNLPTKEGTYILYAKAIDKAGNTSDVKTLEFIVVNSEEETKNPEIIFEDLTTIQVDGVKYVKVSPTFTAENLTAKMDKNALAGETPQYTKLTSDNKIKTGSEITIKGETKYIIIVNGDVNCDGKVTFIGDVIMANNSRIGQVRLSVIQQLAADINNNGEIDFIPDIIAMNNYRLGIVKSL